MVPLSTMKARLGAFGTAWYPEIQLKLSYTERKQDILLSRSLVSLLPQNAEPYPDLYSVNATARLTVEDLFNLMSTTCASHRIT
ncbi:hypothetical protein BH23GEM5_BH23GEM5_05380 [soil metagenome]